jgi:hypothetical protein
MPLDASPVGTTVAAVVADEAKLGEGALASVCRGARLFRRPVWGRRVSAVGRVGRIGVLRIENLLGVGAILSIGPCVFGFGARVRAH